MGALLALVLSAGTDAGVKPPPIAVQNQKLFDDYAANELAADKRYRTQMVEVTSILRSVEKDATDGIVLQLATRNPYLNTYAALDSAVAEKDDRIEKLAPGDKVIVLCVCVGRNMGVPVLGGCVLQKAFRRRRE